MYLHSTTVGKAILAFLRDEEIQEVIGHKGLPRFTENTIVDAHQLMEEIQSIRARGYAIDNEENEPGVRCVSAPVFGLNQHVSTSISVSGPSVRISPARISELSSMVIETSHKVSAGLGMTLKILPLAGSHQVKATFL
jgi:DNA-binding IclR family transcriptional regulator